MRNMFKFRKQDGGAEGGSQEEISPNHPSSVVTAAAQATVQLPCALCSAFAWLTRSRMHCSMQATAGGPKVPGNPAQPHPTRHCLQGGANGEKGRKDSRASEVGHFRPGENRKDGSLKGSLRASAQSKDGSAHEGEGSLGSGGLDPVQEERALRALPQPSK